MERPKHVSKVLLQNTILQTDAHNRVCLASLIQYVVYRYYVKWMK